MRTAIPLTLIAALFVSSPSMASDRAPNIVLILADDLGWGDVGFHGRTDWTTPYLDKLAASGTTFRRWYTAAVVCAPSRAALMTGKYTIHCGVSRNNDDLPSAEVTIAEALRGRGYATALFGKWHHGAARQKGGSYVHPLDHGFDEFFGFTDARHAWEQFPTELWFGRDKKPVEGYANDMFTDRAIEFMRSHRDRPFFLYLPYIATHFHIQAPADEVALHKGKFPERDPNDPLNATYAAMVTRLDKCIGRVVDAIDTLGLARHTMIVFSSDHGATFETGNKGTSNFHDSNRPFRGQKRTLWEGGIRVPGLACWPGKIPAGRVSNDLVHMTDLLPTMLAAAGAEPDPAWNVDGRNLLPYWTGGKPQPERTLFWEWRSEGFMQLAAMRGNLKLVSSGVGRPELYDVEADPGERRDVFAEHPAAHKQLHDALKLWLESEVREYAPSQPVEKLKLDPHE